MSAETSSLVPRRPGVVTFIAVIIYIQAFLAGVVGVVLLAFRDRIADIYAETAIDVSSSSLLGTAIGELVLAGLLLLVASGLMAGSGGARLFVVIVEALRMGFALYAMIFHHEGGLLYSGFVTLLIGVFVIWALYGNERSDEYFERS